VNAGGSERSPSSCACTVTPSPGCWHRPACRVLPSCTTPRKNRPVSAIHPRYPGGIPDAEGEALGTGRIVRPEATKTRATSPRVQSEEAAPEGNDGACCRSVGCQNAGEKSRLKRTAVEPKRSDYESLRHCPIATISVLESTTLYAATRAYPLHRCGRFL
jgi:hypothetical protein